jgi:site-specific DNA-cytosine methylase
MEYKINEQYSKLIPPLSKEEYESLKESVATSGLYHPITINKENEILDGHHRYQICKELNIEPRVEIKTFENKLLEKKFVIESNLKRRQLNDFQRVELAYPLKEIEMELAKMRKLSKLKHVKDNPSLAPIGANENEGKSTEIIAKKAGVSSRTFERASTIIEKAPEEMKEKLRKGEKSISNAYNEIKQIQEIPKFVDGDYRLITPYGENMFRISEKFQTSRKDAWYVLKEGEQYPTLKRRTWFFHEDMREFSLREYAEVQEFPNDFKFVGTYESIKDQIGNAVSPTMAEYIAKRFQQSNCIDLFGGAGGMSLGFEKAGHKVLLMVEWDKDACYTYHTNFPNTSILNKDITKVEVKEIKKLLNGNEIQLIFAGPPCQGFSRSGKRFKDDKRNKLYKEFLRVVEEIKPTYFVMENVIGIISFKDQILEDMKSIGYDTTCEVIKGEEIGMRQKRHRVFFIGKKI